MASPELDPIIHPASRLRLVTALAALGPEEDISFSQLQEHLGMTVGNLSSHLDKLQRASYLTISKTFLDRRPMTLIRLSPRGWEAFGTYLTNLNQLLGDLS
jgi:DNA-binding MarR family transcriptional regulator